MGGEVPLPCARRREDGPDLARSEQRDEWGYIFSTRVGQKKQAIEKCSGGRVDQIQH
jgi:hypothetical protein